MGFPIRKSADQSSLAAPRGLSQLTTSFIASQRQGIHQMPLRHLIALIVDAHPLGREVRACGCPQVRRVSTHQRKDQLASQTIRGCGCRPSPNRHERAGATTKTIRPGFPARTFGWFALFTMRYSVVSAAVMPRFGTEEISRTSSQEPAARRWWSQTESNRRPPACKAGALPTELWRREVSAISDQKSVIQHSARRARPIPDTRYPITAL